MKGIEKIRLMLALMLVSMKRQLPETRRLSSGITTLALAGIVLLVAAGSAAAIDINNANFGGGNYNANIPGGVYDITTPLTCSPGNAGIIIGADGVTINGHDHKITGAAANSDCKWASETVPCTVSGIYNPGYDNVEIKDLEIKGFCTGIALAGPNGGNPVSNNIVDNCEIYDNGFNTMSGGSDMVTNGIHVCNVAGGTPSAPALTIVNNKIHNNKGTGSGCGDGGNGIFIYAGGPDTKHEYCNISYNDLHHNAKSGFWTKMMLSKCNITYNQAWENGDSGIADNIQGGIILRCKESNENFVAHNDASNNGRDDDHGYGIYVGGSSNTIFNNTANDNTASGICMGRSDGSDYNVVSSNTACGNKGYCCDGRADIGTCGGADPSSGCCGNYGDDNTCDIRFNCDGCNDITCPHYCPGTPEVDLRVSFNDGAWDPPGQTGTYTVSYTIANDGYLESCATHARIWIDGSVVATQAVPEIPGHGTYDGTSGPHPVDNTVSVNGATYIDTVRVCADVNNAQIESDETNNCMSNNFGGPDLVIQVPIENYVQWVDESWKTYNLKYRVKNVGDIATTDDVWVNFTELNDEWKDCVDPDPILTGLQPGATTELLTAGPFVMGGDSDLYSDWLEEWVNFDHTCSENNLDDLHGNRARFTEGYPGGCKECGDVNCDDAVDIRDVKKVRKRAGNPNYDLDCPWAADAKCDNAVDIRDVKKVRKRAGNPNYVLDCCKGCDLW